MLRLAPNCFLRPLTEDDVTDAYVEGLNDPIVSKYLVGSRRHRQTSQSVLRYVQENSGSDRDVLFGLFIDDALRGTVRLHDIDGAERTARVGVLVFDRNYWRHGWATRAIDVVVRAAAGELCVDRFWAGMRAENLDSRRTFEGLGFVYQPDEDWVDGDGATHHFFLLVGSNLLKQPPYRS